MLKKKFIGFTLLTLSISSYVCLMGLSATKATAVNLHDFSSQSIKRWSQISDQLNIPFTNTDKGSLSPIINEKLSPLDLVIYGSEIVQADYRYAYNELNIPRMVGQLKISSENNNIIYHAAGLKLLSMRGLAENEGALFYMDVPFYVIDYSSQYFDGQPATIHNSNEGNVRYAQLDDKRYVMGKFFPRPAREAE